MLREKQGKQKAGVMGGMELQVELAHVGLPCVFARAFAAGTTERAADRLDVMYYPQHNVTLHLIHPGDVQW